MRMIDADALEAFVKTVRQGLYLDKTLSDMPTRDSMLLNFQQYVHLQPTIDAVPVVRGEWVGVAHGRGGHECSKCRGYAPSFQNGAEYLSSCCPKCGCDMRGERDGEK